jgi:hypothetical protein
MQKLNKNLLCKLTLLLFFSIPNLFAQEIEWQNTIGGSLLDDLRSIQQTVDGGYILGGFSSSGIFADKTENSFGLIDYWIVKIDSNGLIKWQNTIGGGSNDYLNSIELTSDGGYILGGYSLSNISGSKTENNLGSWDYWIVKTDSLGNIQWQNTIGGSNWDYLTSIKQTTDGGYILGGHSFSNTSGDKTENTNGDNDFWIVKVDSIGIIQWQNTIGGSKDDQLASIVQTSDGGYIIGGFSESNISGDKTENCLGSTDYWIVKTNATGNILWQNTIGGNGGDLLYSLEKTSDGGFILGGYSESNVSGDKIENNKGPMGTFDFWIVKLDSIGSILWQNTIGGSANDSLYAIQQTIDGQFILGGFSNSNISGDKSENNLSDILFCDFWVVKTDSFGNILWQNTIGGDLYDFIYAVEASSDGGCLVGGRSTSDISSDKSEDNIAHWDYWIVKLTEKYNLIEGKIFVDLNSNGIQDSGELPMPRRKLIDQSTSRFAFSDQDGNYKILVLDSGNFNVSPQSVNLFSSVPSSQMAVFTGINQTDSLNDFAFQPQGAFEDVCITITPMGNFRSGFTASYMINYGNYGNTTVAPTVYFYPFNNVTYQSATLTPNNITLDSVVWNLPALTPFQTGSIIITVNVNLGLPIGTIINSNAHIEPYLTDNNPNNNSSNWNVFTIGSFDPNDILVNRSDFTTTELSASPWLEYIIRFQNTGNDTAFTVKILNPIDTFKLNISTIEFVNASHPVNLSWINYQRNMEFKFENILLVDSNTNEPLSHGFVHYRIQPKTNLSAGDSITNFAAIYFDFNEPVITNTAKTIIVLPTGLAWATPTRGKLHVFPNPTENTLNISGIQLENGKAQLRLTDIYGKLIFEKTITSITTTLETNNLFSGIYLIQSGELRGTFVKQ